MTTAPRRTLEHHTTLPRWYRHAGATDLTLGEAWSSDTEPPAIGAKVNVRMNMIGTSTVVSYFTEDGFLGLVVLPDDPPIWYAEQNGIRTPGHVFGAELGAKDWLRKAETGRYRRARVLKKWRLALASVKGTRS